MRANHWKKKGVSFLFSVFLVLTAVSGCLVCIDFVKACQERQFWERIQTARDQGLASEENWTAGDILPQYRELYEKNPDMVGWLRIDNAKIDTPVMQMKADPEYYLRRDFDGREYSGGTPFIDYRCSVSSRRSFNLILYGHYTNGDYLFRRLLDYAYKSRNPEEEDAIYFDTLTEQGVYKVAAAFFYDGTDAVLQPPYSNVGEEAYTFYNYIELDSREGFEKFLKGIEERRRYETGVEITPKDQLLTIVCCAPVEFSGIREGGRFVLVAKKVSDN